MCFSVLENGAVAAHAICMNHAVDATPLSVYAGASINPYIGDYSVSMRTFLADTNAVHELGVTAPPMLHGDRPRVKRHAMRY